ncbi:MAG: hypothetical protein EZS28_042539 [Streblomastix strix]|uniref:Uncharacterized protein n=1 Tax=Streblomastix strix TaxID=222440 RepID=A0A5J4TX08_9EUKA|nr:MAG: hypothetical protein EZS28_042539 [Streblomastix strix]
MVISLRVRGIKQGGGIKHRLQEQQDEDIEKINSQIIEEIIQLRDLIVKTTEIIDHKDLIKEEEEEISEEEVLEEIEMVVIEIAEQRTHTIMVITTICLVQPHGFQLNQYRQLHRIQLFQTSPKDKLVFQLLNW